MSYVIAKSAFNRKISLLTSKLIIELGKKFVSWYVWSIALYGSEICTLRKLEQKYLESWRRMEKIIVRESNEEVLEHVREKRTLLNNILHKKVNWIGHILRRNCLFHDAIEGQMTEVKVVEGRTTHLLDDLRYRRIYFELK
jgi:hypothetical protein